MRRRSLPKFPEAYQRAQPLLGLQMAGDGDLPRHGVPLAGSALVDPRLRPYYPEAGLLDDEPQRAAS